MELCCADLRVRLVLRNSGPCGRAAGHNWAKQRSVSSVIPRRIFSKRFLCPNYYISIDHLRLMRESFYIAREVTQALPIFGAEACRQFQERNQ